MDKQIIYTVGHSVHPINSFIGLLVHYGVNCVVDVRSVAASRFNPQFNKKSLAGSLQDHNISYVHMPDEFGARQTDPSLLDAEGRVDFDKVRGSQKFQAGMARIFHGLQKEFKISLMCSEASPLQCHRFGMISPALWNFDVRHILKDKSFIGQEALEGELLKLYSKKLQKTDLFQHTFSRDHLLTLAYKLLNKDIGYSP